MIKVRWSNFIGIISLVLGLALSFKYDWAYFFFSITAICLIMGLNYQDNSQLFNTQIKEKSPKTSADITQFRGTKSK